ncbi:hypothetical protein PsorP6_013447 [Peronosclerospora sorghi]|uniref:Uncharacterized protein n=1 Tax=Peronosclerospora sorghi TaxID=230839 RepID=A0ACC0VJG9_9STRA|nr:hypothetical protein PsorP6_013447 [Peronosclerospora sorghi]
MGTLRSLLSVLLLYLHPHPESISGTSPLLTPKCSGSAILWLEELESDYKHLKSICQVTFLHA